MATDARTTVDERLLIEAARFVKARSIYPPGHERVRESAAIVLECLRSGELERADRVRLQFRKDEVFVCGRRVPAEHALVAWLLSLARRARLGAVEFARSVDADGLFRLADVIVEGGLRTENAAPPIPETEERGVRLVPMRFTGRHTTDPTIAPQSSAGESEDELLDRLAGDSRVADLVRRIQSEAGPTGGGAQEVEVDLVAYITSLVRAETDLSPDAAHERVVESLERLARVLPNWLDAARNGGIPVGAGDRGDANLAESVARRFFTRSEKHDVAPSEDLPSGRPEDASIENQLEDLVAEFRTLPDGGAVTLGVAERDLHTQLASIWIHLIAQPLRDATPALAARRLRELVTDRPEMRLPQLRHYCGSVADIAPAASARVVAALLENGLTDKLVGDAEVDHRHLAATFPDGFPHAVRALQAGVPGLSDVLRGALREVDGETIQRGVRKLARAGELDVPRIRSLLSSRIAELAPGFDGALLGDDPSLASNVLAALRGLELPEPESSVLRALPERCIPPAFTAELAKDYLQQTKHAALMAESARLLRDFVRYHAESPEHADPCVHAIETLALFPSPETEVCLSHAARNPLFGGNAPRPVRRAARRVLDFIRRKPCA